jgi:hypothetical protein
MKKGKKAKLMPSCGSDRIAHGEEPPNSIKKFTVNYFNYPTYNFAASRKYFKG